MKTDNDGQLESGPATGRRDDSGLRPGLGFGPATRQIGPLHGGNPKKSTVTVAVSSESTVQVISYA